MVLIVTVNAGTKGLVTWDAPTIQEIMGNSSQFYNVLPEFLSFMPFSMLSLPPIDLRTAHGQWAGHWRVGFL